MEHEFNPDEFRQRLLRLQETAADSLLLAGDGTAPVQLDQSRQGRLARMDALQQQAHAEAGVVRARTELARIEGALVRLQNGTYGTCISCEEPVAPGRLLADPCVTHCIQCATQQEQ